MSETTALGAQPAAAIPQSVTDSLGRVLTIRKLDALAELDLIEAAGGKAVTAEDAVGVFREVREALLGPPVTSDEDWYAQ